MSEERAYVEENARELDRLRALVDGLTEEELATRVTERWTVADVLGHMAFWDGRAFVLGEKIERGAPFTASDEEPEDVDWINDAAKPAQLALPPRRAATLAVETARATDHAVATLSDDLLARNAAAGKPIFLLRAQHRRDHLDEIEKVLARG